MCVEVISGLLENWKRVEMLFEVRQMLATDQVEQRTSAWWRFQLVRIFLTYKSLVNEGVTNSLSISTWSVFIHIVNYLYEINILCMRRTLSIFLLADECPPRVSSSNIFQLTLEHLIHLKLLWVT